MTLQESFSAKYIPEPNTGCWLWTACDNGKPQKRYGKICVKGKMVAAHRVAWRLYKGDVPNGFQVCHRCDTPSCVNPDHLFLGTPADNTRDCRAKGRLFAQRKTVCKRGHPLMGTNLYVCPRGYRECRECRNNALKKQRNGEV